VSLAKQVPTFRVMVFTAVSSMGEIKCSLKIQSTLLFVQFSKAYLVTIKTLIKPILCYGSVTWTLTQTSEQMLNTYERKILRRIYGPIHEGRKLASQME